MPLSSCTCSSAQLTPVLRLSDTPGHPGYVVGGFLRDSLIGRASPDIDIAIQGDALRTAKEVASVTDGSYVALKEERRIARVIVPASSERAPNGSAVPIRTIDFVGFEGDITEDLSRRDFTVNALAIRASRIADLLEAPEGGHDVLLQEVIDPFGGLDDLQSRLLRAVTEGVFKDDHGRLLRAVRLATELGFTIDGHTEDLVRMSADGIAAVAGERLREEVLKILAMNGAAESLRHMDRLDLLGKLLPEMEACRGVEQPASHFWDVLEHSVQTVATFEFIAAEGEWAYGNDEMRDCLPAQPHFRAYLREQVSPGATRATLIKLACLLHDVAKPQTKTLTESGRARFLGHTKEGAHVSREILRRLRFSQQECTFVQTLVYNHLRPAQMSGEGLPSTRAVYRFFRDTKDAGFGVLYLALADYLACRGPLYTMTEWSNVCKLARYVIDEHARQKEAVHPPRLITGNDIMMLLNIGPSPTVGRILARVLEAQASGEINSREEALTLARKTYNREVKTVRTAK